MISLEILEVILAILAPIGFGYLMIWLVPILLFRDRNWFYK